MERGFYITLNIKTGSGFEKYGKFFVGEDEDTSLAIFRKMKGTEDADDKNFLQVDFVEMKETLPLNIKMLSCTLDEMTENFRTITKEIFKRFNLKM
ncbi:hypothetical protein LZZ85_27090 [Terrimonas sp. NA20]|uniref:Uncharacterized protein n=1 Tax=Terrimonas ginsenosidimutans TaxID=2908004 RepID=A0ABS9L0F6_9BACT|nr:hypothetical protein [Terrimonas ginsenosidimutans]MCG2617998.1 hypothetical protein [Terrimonas ginsenosidimutans]